MSDFVVVVGDVAAFLPVAVVGRCAGCAGFVGVAATGATVPEQFFAPQESRPQDAHVKHTVSFSKTTEHPSQLHFVVTTSRFVGLLHFLQVGSGGFETEEDRPPRRRITTRTESLDDDGGEVARWCHVSSREALCAHDGGGAAADVGGDRAEIEVDGNTPDLGRDDGDA